MVGLLYPLYTIEYLPDSHRAGLQSQRREKPVRDGPAEVKAAGLSAVGFPIDLGAVHESHEFRNDKYAASLALVLVPSFIWSEPNFTRSIC